MFEKVEWVKTSLQIEEEIDLHVKGWIFQRGLGNDADILVNAGAGIIWQWCFARTALIKDGSSVIFDALPAAIYTRALLLSFRSASESYRSMK